MKTLEDIIKERILILDGAMGTMIQRYHLSEADYRGERFKSAPGQQKGNNDLLTLTRPDVIADIHRRYLEAGADIIETNTFNAQRISLADYHMEALAAELNTAAVHLAREQAQRYSTPDKPRFVAASIGPTNKTASMSPDVNNPALRAVTFDDLAAAYREQIEALVRAGVDALLIETIFDTLNAKAALWAADEAMRAVGRHVPIMLSVTVSDKAGRTLSGQTLQAFLASVAHAPIFSVGLNCSFGARDMKPFLESLSRMAPYYVSAYPNAGLPNEMGLYDQTPDTMAEQMKKFVDEGLVNIIGGCCGTTDAFIARYPALVCREGHYVEPRCPAAPPTHLWLSGLECLEVKPENNFVNIGERCNVAGSKKFRTLIEQKQYDEALAIARKQVHDGAQVVDVNMDDGLLDARAEMVNFLNLLASEPEVARVPVMIDSSKWEVIEAGLKCLQGKGIVNSISLKEGEEKFLQHADFIRRMGAAVVVMAFDEQGQATSFERKIEICQRSYHLLVDRLHYNPLDIVFDPNVLSIATGLPEHAGYAVDFIRAALWIRAHLPGAHVSGGISNLSFSYRGNNYIRQAMHAVFLYHAIAGGRGMDMGIVNPAERIQYADLPAERLTIIEDAVLNRRPDATERLIDLAQKVNPKLSEAVDNGWRQRPLKERLIYALQNGIGDYLQADIDEALESYPHAVDIIEGPLMEGMNVVGRLFGEGKMFLPQVIKTARTMKQAVAILQPHIEAEKTHAARSAGKVLLATVKGDVHDIGKNIVGVVMACNNYEIIDLGVMCPAEKIVETALREKVDMVGLSGLITPSLEEMVNVAKALKAAGLNIPILIGGATTSPLHTALKIAPVYGGPVVWLKDASQNAYVANRLLSPNTHDAFVAELRKEQDSLRRHADEKKPPIVPLEEARKNKLNLFD